MTLRQLNLIIIIQPENPIQNKISRKITSRETQKIQRNSLKKNMTTVDCLSLDAKKNNMNALFVVISWRVIFVILKFELKQKLSDALCYVFMYYLCVR